MKTLIFAAAAALAVVPSAGHAAVAYSAPTDYYTGNSYFTTTSGGTSELAQGFALGKGKIITGISFVNMLGNNAHATPTSLTWSIFSTIDTRPGSVVASGSSASLASSFLGSTEGSRNWYDVSFDVADFALEAGHYYLSIEVVSPISGSYWGTSSFGAADVFRRVAPDQPWAPFSVAGHGLAFTLQGDSAPQLAVPEPATWAMMIAGLAVAGTSMRRRRSRVQFS